MKYTIKSGKKRATPFRLPQIHCGIQAALYQIRFDDNCWFEQDWERDTFKLCGWTSGLIHPKVVKPVQHWDSVRIGCRPSLTKGFIEVFPYVYQDGVSYNFVNPGINKTVGKVVNVHVGAVRILRLAVSQNTVLLKDSTRWGVDREAMIYLPRPMSIRPGWLLQQPYVGEDRPAKQDMTIGIRIERSF